MKATQTLYNLGQSLWLDNITRDLLNNGTLKRYIDELSVTGLTSNPTIFDHAIKSSSGLRQRDSRGPGQGKNRRGLFFDLALDDLAGPPISSAQHDSTNGVDGWVSLEVSPVLAHETAKTRRRRQGALCANGTSQPVHQDPRHEGGFAGH
jgi:transaldolase